MVESDLLAELNLAESELGYCLLELYLDGSEICEELLLEIVGFEAIIDD